MPIYEYRCESCGEHVEKLQKISDAPLKECPACGKPALKKLVSASSFRLKGSGWYETDFKGKKKQSDDGGESKGKKADAGGADASDKSSTKESSSKKKADAD